MVSGRRFVVELKICELKMNKKVSMFELFVVAFEETKG